MLTLSRRTGESIILDTQDGNKIEVKVLRIVRGEVVLGIAAPRSVVIVREELLRKAQEEQ